MAKKLRFKCRTACLYKDVAYNAGSEMILDEEEDDIASVPRHFDCIGEIDEDTGTEKDEAQLLQEKLEGIASGKNTWAALDEGDIRRVRASFNRMTKAALETWAREYLGLELDKRSNNKALVNKLKTAIDARRNVAPKTAGEKTPEEKK